MFGKYRKSFFAIIVIGIILDQLSKNFALSALKDKPNFYFGTRVGFELRYNSGSAFSLFENSTLILTLLSILIIAFIVRYYPKAQNNLMQIALSMIVAGAFGNLIDRFFRVPYYGKGRVVDFLVLWQWPTFNLADSLVTVGVVLAVISTIIFDKSQQSTMVKNSSK